MPRSLLPGLALLLALGLGARLFAGVLPLNHLLLAILLGLAVGNTLGVPDLVRAGVGTHKLWLKTGIVLTGASVALDRVVAAGPRLLLLIAGAVTVTILLVEALARLAFRIDDETGSLLAAGSGICGVSAVVAVAESIDADETAVAYAATTILLFDAVTLATYPAVAAAIGLPDRVFGIWAGLTMFSTGPVTAAGFAVSETAGEWAVLVKLTRNAAIGLVAVAYAGVYASTRAGANAVRKGTNATRDGRDRGLLARLWAPFPKFVVGFVAVVAIANLGLLDGREITSLANAADWLFLLAFVGLGMEIRLDELRATGYRPVLAVLVTLLAVSSVGLTIVRAAF
ncbi:putative sulfate exporter family transporter [Halolamina sp. CBA1230]|uniref:YeiH family protein n=1 Tax=Halolamina sp. CBA1230 TaxID=1853690 RepID=UPI0009A16150|nr:putative sulfate exporter family transporter [Halolamina sp. CBA1230]QKY18887.1 putative sulfate exporter family transporter [Halolamina sp. CBA1230]